ncbi:flagellar hook capping FlgD N-terminal domain-containing protein [Algirhabdus cladophorae]|uniref:flagellar hook capping FlgD N-terminal domain-containing protein n=1 Tax=Algirhabdus cladophorae TaxID=3377108 RepID=UPI003B846075
MDITQTTSVATQAAASSADKSAAAISSDFETFLKMMTAQIENQDPLDPIDSADYAVQLATFSSVEQQVKTNDLLTALGTQMGGVGLTQAAQWVGMEARVAAPVKFSGDPITLSPNPVAAADEVNLIVKNSQGVEVQRQPISVSNETIEWSGVDRSGTPFVEDTYSFYIESKENGQVLATSTVEAYGQVTEARSQNGGTILVLAGGSEVDMASISAVRRVD